MDFGFIDFGGTTDEAKADGNKKKSDRRPRSHSADGTTIIYGTYYDHGSMYGTYNMGNMYGGFGASDKKEEKDNQGGLSSYHPAGFSLFDMNQAVNESIIAATSMNIATNDFVLNEIKPPSSTKSKSKNKTDIKPKPLHSTTISYTVCNNIKKNYTHKTLTMLCFEKDKVYKGKEAYQIIRKFLQSSQTEHGFVFNDKTDVIYCKNPMVYDVFVPLRADRNYNSNILTTMAIYKKVAFQIKYYDQDDIFEDIINSENYTLFQFKGIVLETTRLYKIIDKITNNTMVCKSLFCERDHGFDGAQLLIYAFLDIKNKQNNGDDFEDIVMVIFEYFVYNEMLDVNKSLLELNIRENEKLLLYKDVNYQYGEYDDIETDEELTIYVENQCKGNNKSLKSVYNDFGVGKCKKLVINALDTVNDVRQKIQNMGIQIELDHHLMFAGTSLDAKYDKSLAERKLIDWGVLEHDVVLIK